MKNIARLVLAFILIFGCDACRAQHALTREKVKELLESSDRYRKPQFVPLSRTMQTAGQSYWDIISDENPYLRRCAIPAEAPGRFVCLTQAGLKFFSDISGDGIYTLMRVTGLKFDLRLRVIAVDGIASAPGEFGAGANMAVYHWGFDISHSPIEMQRVFQNPPAVGHAIFLLYDDGWRLEKILD